MEASFWVWNESSPACLGACRNDQTPSLRSKLALTHPQREFRLGVSKSFHLDIFIVRVPWSRRGQLMCVESSIWRIPKMGPFESQYQLQRLMISICDYAEDWQTAPRLHWEGVWSNLELTLRLTDRISNWLSDRLIDSWTVSQTDWSNLELSLRLTDRSQNDFLMALSDPFCSHARWNVGGLHKAQAMRRLLFFRSGSGYWLWHFWICCAATHSRRLAVC